MRITRRVAVPLFVAVLTFCTLPVIAGDAADPELLQFTPLDAAAAGPEVDVIIELAEPPILARRHSRVAVAAASTRLDELIARLQADLGRIERPAPGRQPMANAADVKTPQVRFQYKLTFAGASTRVKRESIAAIRALPYVKAVHIDREMEAHLEKSAPHIGAPAARETYGVRGTGVTIAIIDTGVDYERKWFGNGFGPGKKVAGGYDFYNDDADPMDDNGHGTHVAGIAAGEVEPILGVAPGATLLAYKVLDKDGRGQASTIIAAIDRAVDPDGNGDPSDRADVINMSLGGMASHDDPLIAAVERASAAGVVVVISAGNSYYAGGIGSPGAAASAITVAATKLDDSRAFFSSRGPIGGTWLTKPEIAAPGYEIVSAKSGGGTLSASGTSMAAPHVAGAAALLLERYPDWTPEEVKGAIVSTGKPTSFEDTPGGEHTILGAGGGRVDVPSALAATVLPSPSTVSFGLILKRSSPYSASRTIRLTNRGPEAETVTVKMPTLPKGIVLTVTPETVTIPKGGSAEITMKLDVAANAESTEDHVSATGLVELTGARTVRVPWQVVNGDAISITFDGTESVALAVDSQYLRPLLWPNGPRTVGAFLPIAVDLFSYFEAGSDGIRRLVVRELEPISGYTPITISAQEAKYKVEFAGADERGVPFADLVANGEATSQITQHIILRGTFLALQDIVGTPDEAGQRALWVSPLKETILRGIEVVTKPAARYGTMYRVLRGLERDEKLEVHPGDWAWQAVEPRCKTSECNIGFAAGAGSLAFFSFTAVETSRGTFMIFLTPRVAEEWDFRANVTVQEKGGALPWDYLSPPFRNDGGRFSAAPFGRKVPAADYYPTNRYQPIVLGEGVPLLRVGVGESKIEFDVAGAALGEDMVVRSNRFNFSLFNDATGEPAQHYQSLGGGLVYFQGREELPFRAEASMNYAVTGISGRVSQTTRWNAAERASAVTLTMLRVLDSVGDMRNSVPTGTRARLVFSARDSQVGILGGLIFHRPIDDTATRAWWRPHGTEDWRELPVTKTGEDYTVQAYMPGSPGSIFAADLASATASTGAIDIKIRVANTRLGSSEIVYEPLFLVAPAEAAPRRRAVR